MFSQELQVASSSAEMTTGTDCVIPAAAGRSPLALLQTVFGHRSFKPGQQEAIESMLSGQGLPVKTSPGQNVPRSKRPQFKTSSAWVKTSPSNVLIKPKHITKEMFYY